MDPVTSVLAFLFFGFIAAVLLVIGVKSIRIVPQATVMLVERLGRFDKVANSGLNLLIPFLDRPRAVYWTNTRTGNWGTYQPVRDGHSRYVGYYCREFVSTAVVYGRMERVYGTACRHPNGTWHAI